MALVPGERIVELALEIVLEAMKGQTAEQKKILWQWYIDDQQAFREWIKSIIKPVTPNG